MLNYNTLLSAYDDKLTLMQWLKKVEAALKDASAVSFNVNKRGNATLTFSVVFEDGSELETGPIILQQGESVTNAAITNGHLILTLSNGDTLDAGNTGAVSGFFINAAQHLIVQYQDGTTNDLGAIFNGSITINGDIAATGDILGKIPVLTCSASEIVAQKPVVEDMTGYEYYTEVQAGWTKELVYAGAVKNGNKLTLVAAVNVTKTDAGATGYCLLGNFVVPASVGSKLFPADIGGYGVLDLKYISIAYDLYDVIQAKVYTEKPSSTILAMYLIGSDISALNKKYYIRYEATFLLSDNLGA